MKGKFDLSIYILAAMIAGVLVGIILGDSASVFAPLGQIFIKLIMMLVVPLVAVSILLGSASIGTARSAGKMGIYTFGLYLLTTLVACVAGLFFSILFGVGSGMEISQFQGRFSNEYVDQGSEGGFWQILLNLIPTNPIEMLVSGNILQILFFCIFLGFGLAALPAEKKEPIVHSLNALNDAFVWMIHKIILIAPIGIFGLMADAIGTFGFDLLGELIHLFLVYTGIVLFHMYGIYSMMVLFFTKTSLWRFHRTFSKAQLVAFSTSSSLATLPVTMQVCEEKLGVSKETSSFVLPLGATINMDGGAIYYVLSAVFFANLFGVHLGIHEYTAIVLSATIGSIGQAGIPGPSLLLVAILLSAKIPVIGIPLIFGVDRMFDMLRTVCNITGDAVCALIVDRWVTRKDVCLHS